MPVLAAIHHVFFLLNWFHFMYLGHPWYTGSVWGNVFVVAIVAPLGWVWSKTKFWPLKPLEKHLVAARLSLRRLHDKHDELHSRVELLHEKHDAHADSLEELHRRIAAVQARLEAEPPSEN